MNKETVFSICRDAGYEPCEASWREKGGLTYIMTRCQLLPVLLIFGGAPESFAGVPISLGGNAALLCRLSAQNAAALRDAFPYTAPAGLDGHAMTIGLGDRLGLVTGAHIKALEGSGVFPVLAQQSKRELSLTGRTYRSMLDDVTWQVFEAGYEGGYAADGDHLKTFEEVREAIEDGATMITLDCSEHIDNGAALLSPAEAAKQCGERLDEALVAQWNADYAGKTIPIGNGLDVRFDPETLPSLYLVYSGALAFVERIYHDLIRKSGRRITLEVSIDETETETTPAAHYFAARELQKRGVKIGSVAPRFCGEFQKGIDYIGDKKRFEEEFAVHAQIAKALGYRISVHSGSDKFSIFPYVGKLSGFCFHLKTSGTSWAEAVRVIAACNPELFRRMMKFSCEKFAEAKAYYHVSGQAEKVPPLDGIAGVDLPHLLDETDARQVAHITYGFLLQAAEEKPLFRDEIYDTLRRHKTALDAVITTHIRRHLECLGVFDA
nr:tagaturonate epimerase family protein [uncultured Oscillibacter sp.]